MKILKIKIPKEFRGFRAKEVLALTSIGKGIITFEPIKRRRKK